MDITAELKAWDQRWDASPNGVAHQELMGIAARSAQEFEAQDECIAKVRAAMEKIAEGPGATNAVRIAQRAMEEITRLEGVAAAATTATVDALRGAFKGRPVELKKSLRQEAAAAGLAAQAGARVSEWCEGMRILALKFTAAADEIERLEKELADATGANRV
jgi:hypothetical protein